MDHVAVVVEKTKTLHRTGTRVLIRTLIILVRAPRARAANLRGPGDDAALATAGAPASSTFSIERRYIGEPCVCVMCKKLFANNHISHDSLARISSDVDGRALAMSTAGPGPSISSDVDGRAPRGKPRARAAAPYAPPRLPRRAWTWYRTMHINRLRKSTFRTYCTWTLAKID